MLSDGASFTSSNTFSDNTVATEPMAGPIQFRELPEPLVHVPVLPYYEYRVVANDNTAYAANSPKSTGKHGLFATQDIEAGTRIICEHPIISFPFVNISALELTIAIDKLPDHIQEEISSLDPLNPAASPHLMHLSKEITDICSYLEHIGRKDQRSKKEEKDQILFAHMLTAKSDEYRLFSRWEAAKRYLVEHPDGGQIIDDTAVEGLFTGEARIRHSCDPNCYANSYNDRMTVHTTRAIAAGEELTVSLICERYYKLAKSRSVELMRMRGITCDCDACDKSNPNFEYHEATRLELFNRMLKVNNFIDEQGILMPYNVPRDCHLKRNDIDIIDQDDDSEVDKVNKIEQMVLTAIKDL
jgi:hypothetical protein